MIKRQMDGVTSLAEGRGEIIFQGVMGWRKTGKGDEGRKKEI